MAAGDNDVLRRRPEPHSSTYFSLLTASDKSFLRAPHCSLPKQQEAEVAILCEDCNGIGWLLCDFCKGQKTNVKSETNRIYRRCPSCRAIGQVLCSKCKALECVTFPNYNDGEEVYI